MSKRQNQLTPEEISRINYEKSLQSSQSSSLDDPENFLTEEVVSEVETVEEVPHVPNGTTIEPIDHTKPSEEAFDVNELRSKLSPSGQIVLQTVLDYIDNMYPGRPVDAKTGAVHQYKLFSALKTLFNTLEDRDFIPLYKAILLLFNHHKDTVLSETYVYRFAEDWKMVEKDRNFFRRILNLILVTREPKTRRQVFKQLKTNYVLEFGLTDRAKNRILNFYRD